MRENKKEKKTLKPIISQQTGSLVLSRVVTVDRVGHLQKEETLNRLEKQDLKTTAAVCNKLI